MKTLTFQVLEGVDKGRIFRDLPIPVTIGREEGNLLRLNDERVSRFHAKVQQEDGDVILTDLESTNGTRVNGSPVQIRRLRPGDQIGVGRSMLLFGTLEEIAARKTSERPAARPARRSGRRHAFREPCQATTSGFDLHTCRRPVLTTAPPTIWARSEADMPPLPQKMTPAQVGPSGRDFRLPASRAHHRHREHPSQRGRLRSPPRLRRVANHSGDPDVPGSLHARRRRSRTSARLRRIVDNSQIVESRLAELARPGNVGRCHVWVIGQLRGP